MTTPHFTTQDFYGGAIKGITPHGWIDSSNLREVPDHQEIFLSPSTLSSQIIEINQRVTPQDAPSQTTPETPDSIDLAAVHYHLHDLLDEDDRLEMGPPLKVPMARFPTNTPAYRGVATLISRKKSRRGPGQLQNAGGDVPASVGGAVAGSSADGSLTTQTKCHYLIVRLERQETDLLVFVNVPTEEFDKSGDSRGLSGEEEVAAALVDGLVREFEVVDWDLFG